MSTTVQGRGPRARPNGTLSRTHITAVGGGRGPWARLRSGRGGTAGTSRMGGATRDYTRTRYTRTRSATRTRSVRSPPRPLVLDGARPFARRSARARARRRVPESDRPVGSSLT